jgi:hypothetical protein
MQLKRHADLARIQGYRDMRNSLDRSLPLPVAVLHFRYHFQTNPVVHLENLAAEAVDLVFPNLVPVLVAAAVVVVLVGVGSYYYTRLGWQDLE